MSTLAIDVSGLAAGYNGRPVVRGVELQVCFGEMVALLGPNGAGKSTTLKAISGQLPALAGTVRLSGISDRRLHHRARHGLGVIPERRSVFMQLSCHDNLRLGRGDVEVALSFFPELRSRLRVRGGLLSGGEQQMLSLARILAVRPRIILADELSLGLAPLAVNRLMAALRQATADGAAVLIVEQHPRIALRWAQRAAVMRLGELVMTETSRVLLEQEDELSKIYLKHETLQNGSQK